MLKMGFNLVGDIYKDLRTHQKNMQRGITFAARQSVNGLKNDWRAEIMAAGLGQRLPKTIQSQLYPKNGTSINAAGIVWTKAPHIIAAYDQGIVLRAGTSSKWRNKRRDAAGGGEAGQRYGRSYGTRQGLFLAIPTKNVPRAGRGTRATPSNWPERLGRLRLIPLKNGNALLVADDLRKSYARKTGKYRGYKRATKKMLREGTEEDGVIMFILVKQVRIPKRLDVEKLFNKWSADFPNLVSRNIHRGH